MTQHLLPSGLPVHIAKKDAKSLKRVYPLLTHSQRLDIVCNKNGYSHGWNQFMSEKPKVQSYSGSSDPHRNLLVLATNYLIENNSITLDPPVDYDIRQLEHRRPDREHGHVFATLEGKDSVILWNDIGHEELRISVWWDYVHARHPRANPSGDQREKFNCSGPLAKRSIFKSFVGVTCSGFLERKNDKHLQGFGKDNLFDIYTRKSNVSTLRALPTIPSMGYKAEGKFFM